MTTQKAHIIETRSPYRTSRIEPTREMVKNLPTFTPAALPANRAPIKTGQRGRPRKYRFDLLAKGEYFDYSINGRAAKRILNRLAVCAHQYERHNPGVRFTIRTYKTTDLKVIRVFRVE